MKPVIVFDLGKVLVDFDYGIAAQAISLRGRVSPQEVHRVLHHTPLLIQYECGRLTNQQFFEQIRRATGFDGTLDEFSACFANIFSPMPEMIRLHAELRASGHRTFIFSNTNDLAIHHIRSNFPFFANFEGYVYSYQHGAMKPDAPLYAVVEQLAGVKSDNLVYLDDRAENIEAGKARGWHAFLHVDPLTTRTALRSLIPTLGVQLSG